MFIGILVLQSLGFSALSAADWALAALWFSIFGVAAILEAP